MENEAANRPSEVCNAGRGAQGGAGAESPLQSRAAFLANWSWESVVRHNQGVCQRGGAQHGTNSESVESVRQDWETRRSLELPLDETLDFLRNCHRRAPFLFFNGNTFADIGRTFADYLFAELPTQRRRQATSAIAHYIAGVLAREAMTAIVESLFQSAIFQPGDRVKTLKGSLRGVIVSILEDGRVKWRAETGTEFVALPESLVRDG